MVGGADDDSQSPRGGGGDAPPAPASNTRGEAEADDGPKSRTGRFQVPHRGGTRVEVGEPIHVGGDRPWMCAVKLVGRKRDPSEDPEPTQTLLVRTGRGATAEDARRDALAQLTLVYGSPVEPPPAPVIVQKPSDPPPAHPEGDASAGAAPRRSWLSRLFDRFRGT
jgi:hypothetical protein